MGGARAVGPFAAASLIAALSRPSGPRSVRSAGEPGAVTIPRVSRLSLHVCALGAPVFRRVQGGAADGAGDAGGDVGDGAASAPAASPPPPSSAAAVASADGAPVPAPLPPYARRVLCQVGVIDLLQFFDASKRVENAFKLLLERDLDAEVSAVEPGRYASRFSAFCRHVFLPGAPVAT